MKSVIRASAVLRGFMGFFLFAVTVMGCNMKTASPNQYFDGPYLLAAEAIDSGNEDEFRTSIAHLDVNELGRKRMSLLWYAILQKNYTAIRDLLAAGYRPDEPEVSGPGTPLDAALTWDDVRLLQAMLDGGLSPDYRDEHGTTLLQRAIYGEKAFDHIRLLVERGADINVRSSIGSTVLLQAIDLWQPEIAIYLVEHGADINAHLMSGTSIAWSVQKGIERLDPQAKQAPITAFITDDDGKRTSTVEIPPAPGLSPEGQALLQKYKGLRALMIEKGVKFPPDSPEKVREQERHQ
jgi:uncharacterized protein